MQFVHPGTGPSLKRPVQRPEYQTIGRRLKTPTFFCHFNARFFSLTVFAEEYNIVVEGENREQGKYMKYNFDKAVDRIHAACIAAYTRCDAWVDQLNDYIDDAMDYVIGRIRTELPGVKVLRP